MWTLPVSLYGADATIPDNPTYPQYLAAMNPKGFTYFGKNGTSLTSLGTITLTNDSSYNIAMSPDSRWVVVGAFNPNEVRLYRRSGDTYVFDRVLISGGYIVTSLAWSADSSFVALGSLNASPAPRARGFNVSGNTWTACTTDIDVTSIPSACSVTPDGQYVAYTVQSSTTAAVQWYKRTGTSLTKLTNVAAPTGPFYGGCKWDATGTYLIIDPQGTWYQRSGDTLTIQTTVTGALSSGSSQSNYAWALDSNSVVATFLNNSSPAIVKYTRSGGTLTGVSTSGINIATKGYSIAQDPLSGDLYIRGDGTTNIYRLPHTGSGNYSTGVIAGNSAAAYTSNVVSGINYISIGTV